MDQHAQAAGNRVSAKPRRFQQIRFQGPVNDVVDHRFERQALKTQGQGRVAHHAQAGGVDQQGGTLEGVLPLVPGDDDDLAATRVVRRHGELANKLVGPVLGPVDQANFRRAAADERRHHRPRRPAGAQNHGRSRIGAPSGYLGFQVFGKSRAVRIAGEQAAVGTDGDGVDGADPPGGFFHLVCRPPQDGGEGGFFMGDGDVDSGKALFRQRCNFRRQIIRAYFQQPIVAFRCVFPEPVFVQNRGQGMPDGPAHHPCQLSLYVGQECSSLRRLQWLMMVAAISSIDFRVTSMTIQPCLENSRRAALTSLTTVSRST